MPVKSFDMTKLFDLMAHACPSVDRPAKPFTLILGSGFSAPLIPVTRTIIREDLPWWLWCQEEAQGGPTRKDFQADRRSNFQIGLAENARQRWKTICSSQRSLATLNPATHFELDGDGLPTQETVGQAYRFALSIDCIEALHTPAMVRRYFGDLVRRAGNRLNAAHLFLASLIAARPGLIRTIFTTNFDPLLQRALQLFNVEYFVSDRPETLESPEDDPDSNAVHIIHTHGSIYRYRLASTDAEIEEFANLNQNLLQRYFKRHPVVVVGFSGWVDSITRALKNLGQFDGNLYWCGRDTDPEPALTESARAILAKSTACYVQIASADEFMTQLHQHLVGTMLPTNFQEPIKAARERLTLCDLNGIIIAGGKDPTGGDRTDAKDKLNLGEEIERLLVRLEEAQKAFEGKQVSAEESLVAEVRNRFAAATAAYFSESQLDALPHLDFVIEHGDALTPADRALARFRRGYVYGERGQAGDVERELADYTAVIQMPDAPAEQQVMALVNRSATYGQRGNSGDFDQGISDASEVIEMSAAPTDQKAMALLNRGIVYGKRAQTEDWSREYADYTAVVEMLDAPVVWRSKALVNRAFICGERGHRDDLERAIADYTAVMEMPDVPLEQRTQALANRGATYSKRDAPGDFDRAISDYSAVLETHGVQMSQRAKTLFNRGITYARRGHRGDMESAIADYTMLIGMINAPTDELAQALINRAEVYRERGEPGDLDRAGEDYTAALRLQDVEVEYQVVALVNRGEVYTVRDLPGDLDRAIADCTAVVTFPGVLPDDRAIALINRGAAYRKRGGLGDLDTAIADYSEVIESVDAAPEVRAGALINRRVAWRQRGKQGDIDRELVDVAAVIGMPDAPVNLQIKALRFRAITYRQRDQPGDAELAAADVAAAKELEKKQQK